MKIDILTLFPEMFDSLKCSIIGKAQQNELVSINVVDIRDFSLDKHSKCDDYPFGGGVGMLMMVQPIYDAVQSVKTPNSHVIYLSPCGKTLNQAKVKSLASNYDHLILLCGHYEGIDERAIEMCVDEQISIGDYVLTGGEIPAMVLVDAVCRYLPNVLHSSDSVVDESFSSNLLEYPQYTRPYDFMGHKVPDILLSGHHGNIEKWRKEQSYLKTKALRPDLLIKEELKNED